MDEEALDAQLFLQDLDEDGFGNQMSAIRSCSPPSGYVADGSDCDDGDAATHPAAIEIEDGIDNDCDSLID